jgi:hypothetical protein
MAPEGQWVFMATGRSPTNIAVVKYWGKRDEALILPVNDSISVTLDPGHLSATTTVAVSPSFPSDRMWLNGKVSTNSVSLTNLHSRRLLGLFNDSRERVTAAVRFFLHDTLLAASSRSHQFKELECARRIAFFRADACAARITSSFLDLDRICLKVADIYNSYWAQLQIVCRLFNIKKGTNFCYCTICVLLSTLAGLPLWTLFKWQTNNSTTLKF